MVILGKQISSINIRVIAESYEYGLVVRQAEIGNDDYLVKMDMKIQSQGQEKKVLIL